MGAWLALVLLLPSIFCSSQVAATSLGHSEGIEERVVPFGGRRGLLQLAPTPPPIVVAPSVTVTPPSVPVAAPPVQVTPSVTPGLPNAAPPSVKPPISPPTPALIPPSVPPFIDIPAPDPSGVTSREHLNAIIAGSTRGGVILILKS